METFQSIWSFLHMKALIPFFLIAALFVQSFTGYFRFVPGYFKGLKWNKSFLPFIVMAFCFFWMAHLLDSHAADAARNSAGKLAEMIWNYGGEMGRSIWIFLAFAFILASRNKRLRNLVFGALLGTAFTGLAATILKWLVVRARPSTGLGHQSFFNWEHFGADNRDFQSFPSGDVAIVSGACFFLAFASGKKPWAFIFLLTPLATAFARMHWERHWLSDTTAAILLGVFLGFFIWGYEKYRRAQDEAASKRL